jgi:hypothetical protein
MSFNTWSTRETYQAKVALDNEWGDINIIKRGSKLTPRIIEQLLSPIRPIVNVDLKELAIFYSNLRETWRHA